MARPTTGALSLLFRFALEGLAGQRGRSLLTMLGMAIGTASVVAVVSIGLLGRAYVVGLIEGVGANLVFAYGTGDGINPEEVSFEDVEIMRARVPGVVEIAPVLSGSDAVSIDGEPEALSVLGVTPSYPRVRNLVLVHGRFFSDREESASEKVCLLSRELSERLYGRRAPPSDASLRIFGVRFQVIGVFREAVESAAAVQKSEAAGLTAIVPFSAFRNLYPVRFVDVVYFQADSQEAVPGVVESVEEILRTRHRALSSFKVESLESYLVLAQRISDAVTLGLIAIAAVSLLVGGIGIMNIMLVTVTERTRDIGIRLALGAGRSDILLQFLLEAGMLSLAGGVIGVVIGAGLPWYLGVLYGVEVPVSAVSAAVAFSVSVAVGLFFGLYPARKAAAMNIVDALGYE
ncbi:Macrolide export ATP-binding/permease protein MacB [Myxococcaceae bacterium]|jgi:putative ABC transport system permease protein|nr:Macrolide export ATP-binding/permease protein MacB [Myxococcaceae bacterium]